MTLPSKAGCNGISPLLLKLLCAVYFTSHICDAHTCDEEAKTRHLRTIVDVRSWPQWVSLQTILTSCMLVRDFQANARQRQTCIPDQTACKPASCLDVDDASAAESATCQVGLHHIRRICDVCAHWLLHHLLDLHAHLCVSVFSEWHIAAACLQLHRRALCIAAQCNKSVHPLLLYGVSSDRNKGLVQGSGERRWNSQPSAETTKKLVMAIWQEEAQGVMMKFWGPSIFHFCSFQQ